MVRVVSVEWVVWRLDLSVSCGESQVRKLIQQLAQRIGGEEEEEERLDGSWRDRCSQIWWVFFKDERKQS